MAARPSRKYVRPPEYEYGQTAPDHRIQTVRKIRPQNVHKTNTKADHYDFTMLFLVIILVLFGIVMVFSSSYYHALTSSKFSSMYYFVRQQIINASLGFIAMVVAINFNYKRLKPLSFLAYAVSCVLLIMVQLVGRSENGSKRWLDIGPIGFQPSEIAKIAVILYLAYYISTHKDILKTFKGFIQCVFILIIPVILIGMANLSTAIVVFGIGAVMIFVASPKIWYFVAGAVPIGILGYLAVTLEQFSYRFDRIKYWLDPFSDPQGKGFQTIQSLYAIASGGLFGLGLGQSRQKTFLPEAYNDIIFAIICEELGLVGAAIVILLFAILIWRGVRVALNAQDMYGCLVALGIISMIGIQVIINIAVVTNTIPNTGIPLPFISYGGTSLIFTLASMGVLLNISRYQKKD